MIPSENDGMAWHGVWFPGFIFIFNFVIFVLIYFHELNDELDVHKEKIF